MSRLDEIRERWKVSALEPGATPGDAIELILNDRECQREAPTDIKYLLDLLDDARPRIQQRAFIPCYDGLTSKEGQLRKCDCDPCLSRTLLFKLEGGE